MAELIEAVAHYDAWLYALLAFIIGLQVVTMWRAGRERDLALFELERQAATGKAVRAFVTLMLLVVIGAGIYTVARVIAPALPAPAQSAGSGGPLLLTPQLLDTPTPDATLTPTPGPTRRAVIVTPTPTPSVSEAPGTPTS